MSRIALVRYATKPEAAAENETLSRAVFAELRKRQPKGIAYTLLRDGDNFVHLFVNTAAEDSSPLLELPAFKTFSKDNQSRFAAPPDVMRLDLHLVDSYGLPVA